MILGTWNRHDGDPGSQEGWVRFLELCVERAEMHSIGRLCLAGTEGGIIVAPDGCLAVEGFVLGDGTDERPLPDLLDAVKAGRLGSLSGHFSLAWADVEAGRLILAVDPSGGHRLFYTIVEDRVVFSTSLSAIAASREFAAGRETLLNDDVVAEVAICGLVVFGSDTIYRGISEVPAGRALLVDGATVSLTTPWRWWEADVERLAPTVENLRGGLYEALRRAAGGDGRLAIALSGGDASALLASLAVELLGRGNVHAYACEPTFQRARVPENRARSVCEHLRIQLHLVEMSIEDFRAALVPTLAMTEDTPLVERIRTRLISRCARADGFRKIIAGDGVRLLVDIPARQPLNLFKLFASRSWRSRLALAWRWQYRRLSALYPILALLRNNGLLARPASLLPGPVWALMEPLVESPRVARAVAEMDFLPLRQQFAYWMIRDLQKRIFQAQGRLASTEGIHYIAPAVFLYRRVLPDRMAMVRHGSHALPPVLQPLPGTVQRTLPIGPRPPWLDAALGAALADVCETAAAHRMRSAHSCLAEYLGPAAPERAPFERPPLEALLLWLSTVMPAAAR